MNSSMNLEPETGQEMDEDGNEVRLILHTTLAPSAYLQLSLCCLCVWHTQLGLIADSFIDVKAEPKVEE